VSIAAGVEAAAEAVDSGAARRTLEAYVALSRELAP
jgi:anthranilate phosphoribosyltransferase